MAGHSQFKNIMHRKGAQDARRAKVFTKLIREISTAARVGLPDPQANPRLRAALQAARVANMPKDTVERAIKRGLAASAAMGGADTERYEEVRYEGYGPGGVAVIVEALTDNRHRAAADIRAAFTRYGGTLGESNSVAYQFARVGRIAFPAAAASGDAMFEAALDCGADDCASDADGHEVTCGADGLNAVRDALEARFGAAKSARLVWRPRATVAVADDKADVLLKLLEALEDNDDVQDVFANFEVSDKALQKINA